MPDAPVSVGRVRLARSATRLLVVPLAVLVAGAALVVGGLLAPAAITPLARMAIALAGGVLAVAAAIAIVVLLSIRLDVEESALYLHWFGGRRRYGLARGPVTRVAVRGPEASPLRVRRLGLGGVGMGRGRLRADEEVEAVVLAPLRTVIMVPTERGRLAIAAHDEAELLDALSRAAQARRRIDEAARAAAEVEAAALAPPPAPEPPPRRELTGIERALLEEQLAAERRAAEEREAALRTVFVESTETAAVPPGAAAEAASEPAVHLPPAPPAQAEVIAAAEQEAPSRRRTGLALPGQPGLWATAILVVLPLALAGAAWLAMTAAWLRPPIGDDYRLTMLALVLGGPATSLAAVMARIWWPRLVGVVVTSGLAALVVAVRSLLGIAA